MKNLKNDDLVIIKEGNFSGKVGKIVDNEGPVMWVMISPTKEVVNVHENHLEKFEGSAMRKEDCKEYENLFKSIGVDVKLI